MDASYVTFLYILSLTGVFFFVLLSALLESNWYRVKNFFGMFNWGVGHYPHMDLFEKTQKLKTRPKNTVQLKMFNLTRELIKINYLKCILDEPPLTAKNYEKKFLLLKELEDLYPNFKVVGSPTDSERFNEENAIFVYGKNEWDILKNTLNLIVKEK